MINWRKGLSGFVGGYKTAIKGVFEFAHSITTAPIIDTPDCHLVLESKIDPSGVGVASKVAPFLSLQSSITGLQSGLISPLDLGISLSGIINPNGQSLASKITPAIGLQGHLCNC